MIYANDGFYAENYLAGKKPVIRAGFNFYAREASRIIDQYTFGRLKALTEEDIPEDVKMCCCEMAEQCFQAEAKRKEAGKTSEKVGNYSATFASGSDVAATNAKEKKDIVMKWLAGTGLCYRGI